MPICLGKVIEVLRFSRLLTFSLVILGFSLNSWSAQKTYHSLHDHWPVRSKPGTHAHGSRIVGHVSKNQTLTLVRTEKDHQGDLWYLVNYQSGKKAHRAYIYSHQVREIRPSQTSASVCTHCSRTSKVSVAAQSKKILHAIDDKGGPSALGRTLPHLGRWYSARCSEFINKKGLGYWGKKLVHAIETVAPTCFYKRIHITNLCPRYNHLSRAQKNTFWAMVFASISQKESSCNPHVRAKGSNGLADGLFQLEYASRLRRLSGRNSRWCQTRGGTNTQNLTFQMECSVSMINDTVCSHGRHLNYAGGYWQELRLNGAITRLIRNSAKAWKFCR